MYRSGAGLGWVGFGMFVWGVLWVGMHSSGAVVLRVVWCGVLVRLESRVTLWLAAGCCVSGGILLLVGSLSGMVLWFEYERLRL